MKRLFVMACVAAMAGVCMAQHFGGATYMGNVTTGAWTAVQGVTVSVTNGGIWTNGVTYTNIYRVGGTNYAGRLPLGTNMVAMWVGSSSNNAVRIGWTRKYGVAAHVVERSLDGGSTWTNWIAVGPAVTNLVDAGTNVWNGTDFAARAAIPGATRPWDGLAGTGSVAAAMAAAQAAQQSADAALATGQTAQAFADAAMATGVSARAAADAAMATGMAAQTTADAAMATGQAARVMAVDALGIATGNVSLVETGRVVTIDAADARTNTLGGILTILGISLRSSMSTVTPPPPVEPPAVNAPIWGVIALGHGCNIVGQSGQSGCAAIGKQCVVDGNDGSIALGYEATASGSEASIAIGRKTTASGIASIAIGYWNSATAWAAMSLGRFCTASNDASFVWSGASGESSYYGSKGDGTFCVNPTGGVNGVYIGEDSLGGILNERVALANVAWRTNTFIAAIYTNDLGAVTGITEQTIIYLGAP
jgi:hypothetical protein